MGRHYTALAKEAHGVNDGFYPLGSCTMKHNPKIDDAVASLRGFTNIHPLQPAETVEGCTEAIDTLESYLCEITGMDHVTFQSSSWLTRRVHRTSSHKAYLRDKGLGHKNEILIPDAAHGTNPASAAMAGFKV